MEVQKSHDFKLDPYNYNSNSIISKNSPEFIKLFRQKQNPIAHFFLLKLKKTSTVIVFEKNHNSFIMDGFHFRG